MFNVVPSQKRGQVLAFNNGVPSQIGVVLSGVLLIVAKQALTTQQIFLMGTVLAVVCGILIWRMRAAYAQALVDALRAGRVEVFSEHEASFSGLQGDATAFNVAIRALDDSKATTRRLAAEMLGRMEVDSAIPHLTRLLSDLDPGVRASAVASLGVLYADSVTEKIIPLLKDDNEQVRQEVLMAISRLNVSATPALTKQITELATSDPSLGIQTKALIALFKLDKNETVLSKLDLRLRSDDPQIRISALEAVGKIAPSLQVSLDTSPIRDAIEDSSVNVRRAAVLGLGKMKSESISKTLVKYLSDPDAGVRNAAAEVLRNRSDESRAYVLEIIKSKNGSIDSALDALAPGNPERFLHYVNMLNANLSVHGS